MTLSEILTSALGPEQDNGTDWRKGKLVAQKCFEEAARVCDEMQQIKNATIPDGAWKTLGTTEISGHRFAEALRAKAKEFT